MAGFFTRMPFLLVLMGIGAVAMFLPTVVAVIEADYFVARVFFYSGLIFTILVLIAGIAAQGLDEVTSSRTHLASLFVAYLALPAMLAVPVSEAIGTTRFLNAYFEMVSSLTTTGATVYAADRLSDAVHLWRALVGWMGGFLIWLTAAAVLAPLTLGGFEVTSEAETGVGAGQGGQMRAALPTERLRRHAIRLAPIYAALTGALWALLVAAGEEPLVGVIHAMSTLATSGITSVDGLSGRPSGPVGEVMILFFLVFALTRRAFTPGRGPDSIAGLAQDRELRLALVVGGSLAILMFLRHWIGALEVSAPGSVTVGFHALWGNLFTVMSFLSTTGFISDSWIEARAWSGLRAPGLVLIGLALMGGGVATTAGGVKLLRVYSLYKHGARELGKLVHPHSVAGAGPLGRRIHREGAYIAWIFFMLFVLSMAAVMGALSFSGLDFEQAMVLAVATLSTTGPLASVAGEAPIPYAQLDDVAKMILAAAMIVGRLETLVLIALVNPGFWRA